MLKSIGGEITAQDINDNFSYLDSEKLSREQMPYIVADGVVADKTTNNDTAIQVAIDALTPPATLYIPNGVKWDYRNITHPYNITIMDDSGYDWFNDAWTAQRKVFLNTDNPSSKNANEYLVIAPYHPGLIIENNGGGSTERRASVVIRQDGVSLWRIGKGIYNDDDDFVIAEFPSAKTMFAIKKNTLEIGYGNAPRTGVSHYFKSRLTGANIIAFENSAQGENTELHFYDGSSTIVKRIRIKPTTGDMEFIDQNGSHVATLEGSGAALGFKKKVLAKTANYTVPTKESGAVYTNTGAAGGFTFTLPTATTGLYYEFYVTAGQNLTVDPQSADSFRGLAAGKYKRSSAAGSVLKIKCVVNGVWEFEQSGTWTDEA